MNEKYSEKELLIFEGFKKLILNNKNIKNIKVEDIAKSAGIGKGTMYEYFKNKDEIITKSIIYNVKSEIINTIETIKNVSTFKEQFYHLFYYSVNSGKFIFPCLKILYFNVTPNNLDDVFFNNFNELNELKSQLCYLLDYIINTGIKENIIDKNLNINYDRYVLLSASMTIINSISKNYFQKSDLNEEVSIYKQRDFAYNMILKSLS